MKKKDLLPMPFVLSIGIMVLAVITAVAFAEQCNKYERSDQITTTWACQSSFWVPDCLGRSFEECQNGQTIDLVQSNDQFYFGCTYTGNAQDHAVQIEPPIVCGYVLNCYYNLAINRCFNGSQVINPSTGEPEQKTRPYYDYITCYPGE